MTLVGWDVELPLGRFEHLQLICESTKAVLPNSDSEYYDDYLSALEHARQLNHRVVQEQIRQSQSQGWVEVPFTLAHKQEAMRADKVGNYAAAAMQLLYQLTRNQKIAWAVMQHETIVHVRARCPQKQLDELTYQVWYHKQLYELKEIGGVLLEGNLMVCESGLWFEAKK
jgi:hypothetical protein